MADWVQNFLYAVNFDDNSIAKRTAPTLVGELKMLLLNDYVGLALYEKVEQSDD